MLKICGFFLVILGKLAIFKSKKDWNICAEIFCVTNIPFAEDPYEARKYSPFPRGTKSDGGMSPLDLNIP